MSDLSTLSKKGHVEVGHKRQSTPIKIYYELHGNGPERVLLVMGKYFGKSQLSSTTDISCISRSEQLLQFVGFTGTNYLRKKAHIRSLLTNVK